MCLDIIFFWRIIQWEKIVTFVSGILRRRAERPSALTRIVCWTPAVTGIATKIKEFI